MYSCNTLVYTNDTCNMMIYEIFLIKQYLMVHFRASILQICIIIHMHIFDPLFLLQMCLPHMLFWCFTYVK